MKTQHLQISTVPAVLYGEPAEEEYVRQHNAKLTVMEGGEYWFHTPQQLAVLREWEEKET